MHGMEVLGHRGARALFPENTLAGFQATAALGIRSVELDVAITADGVPVVHHDPALNPDMTRDGKGRWLSGPGPLIRDLSWAQLARYDVGRIRPGSALAARFPDQQPRDGAGVPSLESVLRLPFGHVLIELKLFPHRRERTVPVAMMVDRTVAAVNRVGARDRVTLQSFDWSAVRHVRHTDPALPRAWLTDAETVADGMAWLGLPAQDGDLWVPRAIAAEGGGGWAPHHASLKPEQVAEAQRLGLRVLPWTVNDADAMDRLIRLGVDGIISDRPDLLRERVAASSGPV